MPESQGLEETREEKLTRQFYEWEGRGRGWQIWNEPVVLEPPFRPFLGHYVPSTLAGISDDGRKPTFFSSLFSSSDGHHNGTHPDDSSEDNEPSASIAGDPTVLVEVQIILPPETKITKDAARQFLLSLGHVSHPISFEVVGTSDSTVVQIACARHDRRQVREQLQAYFPEAVLTERNGYLDSLWNQTGTRDTVAVEFGLSKEFMRPLRCYDRFEPDPLAGLIGAMVELARDEVAVFQILFVPVRHPWPESIVRAVTDGGGDDFFADDSAMVSLASEKISCPLFAAIIRVAAQSSKRKRAARIVEGIGKSLRQFAESRSNELIPLSNDGYDDAEHGKDVVNRQSRRSGMLLNCDELVSVVHLPSASARSVKLKREERKTKTAPTLALGHQALLGHNDHAGKTVRVTLSADQRVRHMHVIGASGSGKSTLLLNLIVQDIHNGEGVAVLDPHGDLIDQILERIPEERVRDVVLFDPSDEAYPVGFNILSTHSELERNLLASDLVSVFRRLSTSFGDQMHTVLGNAIMAILESNEGGTLADLRRFLVEADFRQSFLQTVRDPEIVYYWQKEFPLLTGKPQGPILTRLDTFLRPKIIRHMVCQKEDRLNFGAIMNGRKIVLAKLAQGLIGEENSYLLGTLLVSKLSQTAMSRQNMAASERKPFYLYVDEFHNFVTPSMAAILAGARKYNFGLVLAHQELHQLSSRDSEVASAVISNPYTRVCFRLGDFDAKKLEEGFSSFKAKDLQNLGIGQAICRIERAEYDFNLAITPLQPIAPEIAALHREQIVAFSRQQYATSREEVIAQIYANRSALVKEPASENERSPRIRVTVPLPEPKMPSRPEGDSLLLSEHPATPGRGGDHHKYLQQLIKRWAESRGFAVTIEKPILDGLGSVDVALEKKGRAIACEISVTTDSQHEMQNIQKCLAAGFEYVVLVSSERKLLAAAKKMMLAGLGENQCKQVRFLSPEQVFSFLETVDMKVTDLEPPDPNELLTAKELEELLRIDVKTIYSYAQRGLLPYVRIQSNLRFLRSEILKWMEERQFKPASRTRK